MIYYKKIIYLLALSAALNIESNTNIEYSIEMIFVEYEDVLSDDEQFNEVFNIPDESIINIKSKEILLNKKAFLYENEPNPLQDALSNIKIDYKPLNENKPVVKNSKSDWFYKNEQLDILETIYKNLRYRKGVKAIDKVSWNQPITSYDDAKFVYYQNSKIGTYIKFYESRYLHASIKSFVGNLSHNVIQVDRDKYIKNIAPDVTESLSNKHLKKIELSYFEENSYIENKEVKISNSNNNEEIIYYIDENMRLFDKRIYFLDHPKFGIFISLKKINS
ncbi:MAG: hypothetical protein NT02SARS_1058 [SAR86 cluster bacterium SAR86B]|uniref:Uncharacterized protein n=1 Tax=SAR86 cluster bacterium SAR86B TaxID=1123867 RepID=J4V243_9GAMM|nr:MAG: hypothetical protein NT02SARS_1058 [SAR86 cluster bacterium SAR86B]